MNSRSIHKHTKIGCLPGDLPKHIKIAMLEGNVPIQLFPWQIIGIKCAKSFKRDFQQRAKKRFRQKSRLETDSRSYE